MANVSVDQTGEPFLVSFDAARSLHAYQDNMMVRFGHTDNITVVFDPDAGQTTDYALGLIFVGAIILGVFLIWATTLMVLMCVGNRVGFMSGAAFVRKPILSDDSVRRDDSFHNAEMMDEPNEPPTPNAQYLNQHAIQSAALRNQARKSNQQANEPLYHGDPWQSRPSRLRIMFILSGIICFAFAILMVTQGITNLNTTVHTVDSRAEEMNELAESAKTLIRQGFLDLINTADALRVILLEELSDDVFCPDRPSGIPLDNQVARQIQDNKNQLTSMMDQLYEFQEDKMADLEEAMNSLVEGTSTVSDYTESYSASDWQSLIVLIPYTVFPSLLVVAAMMALFDVSSPRYTCFVTWFVMPFFILMTVVAFVFAAAMSIAAGVNADFCLPGGRDNSSPDELMLALLEVNGQDKESLTYQAAEFYIKQCSAGIADPLSEIRSYQPDLTKNIESVNQVLVDFLDEGKLDELALFCNRDFEIIPPLMHSTRDVLDILENTLTRLLDLASCARIIPLYTDTVYNAGCTYSPKAVFWIFSCALILGFFGMIMVTLRSSMKATVPVPDYTNHFPQSDSIRKQATYTGDEVDNSPDRVGRDNGAVVQNDEDNDDFPMANAPNEPDGSEEGIETSNLTYPPYSYTAATQSVDTSE